MSNLKQLDGKKISVKLKYGATEEDILEYFNCTDKQLKRHLKKNFSSKAVHKINYELRRNKKKKAATLATRSRQIPIGNLRKRTLKDIENQNNQTS